LSDQWYYGQNGVQKGPVSIEVMQQLLHGGHLKRDDLVWKEGMANWVPASTVAELFPSPAAPIPPTPPAPSPYSNPSPPIGGGPAPYPLNPSAASLQSKATTALVLGICSIIPGSCCSPVGLGLGIAAIIIGKNAEGAPNAGAARAGFVCGIVGIVLSCLSGLRWIVR